MLTKEIIIILGLSYPILSNQVGHSIGLCYTGKNLISGKSET